MAVSTVATGLTVKQWDDNYFTEYMQENLFSNFMGTDENSVIQVKEDLTKKKGDAIHFALVNRLTNDAVLGSNYLTGAEENLDNRSHRLTINQRRNGVLVPVFEEQKSAIPLREAAKSTLKAWSMEDTRDLIIEELGSINRVPYATATETQKDEWLVDNADRVLFGKLKSNGVSNDHSTALATLDNTDDKLTASALSLMKRIALSANPKIRPITVDGGKRNYVVFAGPQTFRDLKNDAVVIAAQRESVQAMQNNKLFVGGDIYWDGMIVHEVDDIPVYSNGTIAVAPVYLCGAQAMGMGWAKRWQSVEEEFDYKDKQGVATRAWMDVDKLLFGTGASDTDDLKQAGVVTGWFASVADS